MGEPQAPQPPTQIADHDLTSGSNGKAKTATAARLPAVQAEDRSPAAMMRAMGFDPTSTMTPLQFLCAVFNDDLDKVFKNEKRKKQTLDKGGIGLAYRIECAKTAAKYMHMEMPKVTVEDNTGNFGEKLAAAHAGGLERVKTRRIIMEEIERISPDIPLPPANYPPVYDFGPQAPHVEESGMTAGEVLDAEGLTNYNPDEDHA